MPNSAKRDKFLDLNDRQKLFCEEYVVDLKPSEAAKRAGYSVGSASMVGYQLLRKPAVKRYVNHLINIKKEKSLIKAEEVVREIARLSFCNIKDVCSWDSSGNITVVPSESMTREISASICKIKYREMDVMHGKSRYVEVSMFDKMKALDMLCRHLGVYLDGRDDIREKEVEEKLSSVPDTKIIEILKIANAKR